MAEFFTTVFALAGKAVAGTAAAVGGGGLTSAFSAASTIIGGLSSIAAGQQQKAALQAQARMEELQATQDEIAGRQEAVNIIRKMNQDAGANLVASYASGLQASGSTTVAISEAQRTAERSADLTRSNAQFSAAARRESAAQRRQDAKAAGTGGIFGAITGGLNWASRQYQRG